VPPAEISIGDAKAVQLLLALTSGGEEPEPAHGGIMRDTCIHLRSSRPAPGHEDSIGGDDVEQESSTSPCRRRLDRQTGRTNHG